ncbi:hypothetical protein R1flu_017634 [Riccia fluitans]|uniref:Uncharacterized protein n=1 Tax=Riccia fluitans TaxID=41844 RepID=A0ABD1ZFW5_9MARC
MAPRSSKGLNVKTKEVKIPHLMVANKKKMETWGLGGLFAVDWNKTYEDLVEELAGHPDQKVAVSKYEYQGKPRAWTSDIWREVYNLRKASPRGYVMKEKAQFTKLQLLRLVKGNRRQSESGVFLEQVKGDYDFVLFCQMLNAILAPTVSDSDIKMKDEKEPKEEISHPAWEGEANASESLDQKIMVLYDDWEIRLQNLGWCLVGKCAMW